MIHIVVAVRDSAVDAYMPPFCVSHAGRAVRAFTDEVNRKDSELGKHPSDFALFEIGVFDDESGRLTPLDAPRQLSRASDVLVKEGA